MGARRSCGNFFTNEPCKSGLIDYGRGVHVQVVLFMQIVV